jgi:hypothetical protein
MAWSGRKIATPRNARLIGPEGAHLNALTIHRGVKIVTPDIG